MVLSIAPPTVSKKKKTATNEEELFGEEVEVSDEDNDEDNIDNDGLIKVGETNLFCTASKTFVSG